ncbi:hypothetical protein Q8A67_000135 [Cirrhinus molitorella]|uniref:AIG1-type G domain-containing protein n=1 Tax=Cirrhinus molitorella TaxID=172907 RepID=A0AA88U6G7_9TELE|nr:hypothetical protein Q8A67_000135 [Cirrhinus molitorella]
MSHDFKEHRYCTVRVYIRPENFICSLDYRRETSTHSDKMTDSNQEDSMDTSEWTEEENSKDKSNLDLKDLTESDQKRHAESSVPFTSQDKTLNTENNEQPVVEGSNSKADERTDVSEAPESSVSSMNTRLPHLTIVITGNSSSVQFGHENILLGEKHPNVENEEISRIVPVQRKISDHPISVITMTGLHETDSVDHLIDQLVNKHEIHVFIFVVRLGQLTDADKMGLDWLQRVFGDKVLQFVMILFTYENEKECDTIIDDLKKNPVLEQLLEKCGGRYQTCNNMMNNQSEMRDLMSKMNCLFNETQQQCYTREMYNTALRQREDLENSGHKSKDTPAINKGTRESTTTTETRETYRATRLGAIDGGTLAHSEGGYGPAAPEERVPLAKFDASDGWLPLRLKGAAALLHQKGEPLSDAE